MVERVRRDLEAVDVDRGVRFELHEREVGGHILEEDGEIVGVILVTEPGFEFVVTPVDGDGRSRGVDRREEGKSADMIPMRVAHQNMDGGAFRRRSRCPSSSGPVHAGRSQHR